MESFRLFRTTKQAYIQFTTRFRYVLFFLSFRFVFLPFSLFFSFLIPMFSHSTGRTHLRVTTVAKPFADPKTVYIKARIHTYLHTHTRDMHDVHTAPQFAFLQKMG